jgi:hypothetical protein
LILVLLIFIVPIPNLGILEQLTLTSSLDSLD